MIVWSPEYSERGRQPEHLIPKQRLRASRQPSAPALIHRRGQLPPSTPITDLLVQTLQARRSPTPTRSRRDSEPHPSLRHQHFPSTPSGFRDPFKGSPGTAVFRCSRLALAGVVGTAPPIPLNQQLRRIWESSGAGGVRCSSAEEPSGGASNWSLDHHPASINFVAESTRCSPGIPAVAWFFTERIFGAANSSNRADAGAVRGDAENRFSAASRTDRDHGHRLRSGCRQVAVRRIIVGRWVPGPYQTHLRRTSSYCRRPPSALANRGFSNQPATLVAIFQFKAPASDHMPDRRHRGWNRLGQLLGSGRVRRLGTEMSAVSAMNQQGREGTITRRPSGHRAASVITTGTPPGDPADRLRRHGAGARPTSSPP